VSFFLKCEDGVYLSQRPLVFTVGEIGGSENPVGFERRDARAANSTRYVMFSADVVEYFFGWASASVGYVIKSLADAFVCVGTGRNVEQALIDFGILHDSRCFCPSP
jgi:hypothetical protein